MLNVSLQWFAAKIASPCGIPIGIRIADGTERILRVPDNGGQIQTLSRLMHRPKVGVDESLVIHLALSSPKMTILFKSGDAIPESGLYKVLHAQHRLPHQVTLVEGQTFPPCAQCHDEVRFELIRGLPALARERRGSVSLYALPVLDDEEDASK